MGTSKLRTAAEEAEMLGITHSRIIYGYPTSDLAEHYEYGKEGCYVVVGTVGDELFAEDPERPCHLAAFGPDKAQANRYADELRLHGIERSRHDVGA